MATAKDDDQQIPGKQIWKRRCGQQDTITAGGRWRQQHRTELKMQKRVVCGLSPVSQDFVFGVS